MRFSASVCVILALLGPAAASPAVAAGAVSAAEKGQYAQVFAAIDKDHFAEAEGLALQAKSPLLAKLVRWMIYVNPRSGASFEEISSFIDSSPDWPQLTTLQRRAEEAITAATPSERVAAWFGPHRRPLTADGGMALARALLALGQQDQAVAQMRRSWTDSNFGAIQEKQFLAMFSDYLTEADHWRRLDRLLWDRQEGQAQHMLLKVPAGRRLLAQARLALQDLKSNPEPFLAKVPKEFRDDPGLIYDRVRWRRIKDMDEDAIDLLSHPARNKVRPDLWWQESGILARRALQKGLVSRAYQMAADHALPDSAAQFSDAEFLAGWIALRFLDDKETAAHHFQRLWDTVKTPLSLSRAAYWAGRAAEARGDNASARRWYERGAPYVTAYYGQLSAARLNDHRWPLPADPAPTPADRDRFDKRELVRATRLLMEMGENDSLRGFFLRLNEVAESPGERALVANLAQDGGRADLAVTVARRADRDSVFLVGPGWPVLPLDTAGDGPELPLVLALIRQESGFIADVQSPVGARGLMQLMPATAKQVARAIKVAFSANRLDEPSYNVRLGSAYLQDIIDDFQGSYVMALAAYNAGPSRVKRWAREFGDPREAATDVVDWIEMIPFTETRNYVQRVMESLSIYRRKLGSDDGTSFEADLKRWARRSG